MDDHDEFDDHDLEAVLRRHAAQLTGPVDTDGALADVQRRAHARRRRRTVTATLAAAAAAALIVVAAGFLIGDDRSTLRSPAASADVTATSTAPTAAASTTSTPVAPPSVLIPVPPSSEVTDAPVASIPATVTAAPRPTPPPPTTADDVPDVPTTQPDFRGPETAPTPTPTPTTSSFTSAGGSIVVRLAGGAIALVGDPSPSAGWSFRIDDDGPSRVRVRFERESQRSEIRVELQGDRLVPEIIEQ